MKNKFCKSENLKNESDVEQFFIIKLLEDLDFSADYIETKKNIKELKISKGKKQKTYNPDYILYSDKKKEKPIILIDAKHPQVNPEEGVLDAQLYTSIIRRKIKAPKPEQYCIGTNGLKFIMKHYESDEILFELSFEDFVDKNKKYERLKSLLNLENIKELEKQKATDILFKFEKPTINFVKDLFVKCHNLIWKRDKKKPTKAFHEFSKIIFIKLKKDRELKEIEIEKGFIEPKDAVFSVSWIEQREKEKIYDPFNDNLFKDLREGFEDEIIAGKKRIFEKDERIDIKPSTIKEAVRLLEHYNLSSIDEDLNGRMFEIFLRSTVRGRELGQYFTPRCVVDFMTYLANLKITEKDFDVVLDACCGSGGFLIETMAIMTRKIKDNSKLTNKEQEKIIKEIIHKKCLFGIDADKDIAKISRMNMYLHGDGGSNIYCTDALDKDLAVEKGLNKELVRDLKELREIIIDENKKFNVVLTNPPFSMKYEKKTKDEKKILEQYELGKNKKTGEIVTSEKSNILFVERYLDLLEEKGKLITIIDDTILNGVTGKKHRAFIKKHFIIKAVISLPFNTFKNAETSTKTSILFLRKKESEDEGQPAIFMAICNNIGHNDFGKETLKRNNLELVLEEYKNFEKTGDIESKIIMNQSIYEGLTCPLQIFLVKADELKEDRLDAFYYSPELKVLHNKFKSLESKDKCEILDFNNIEIVKNLKKEDIEEDVNKIYKYIEVGDVSKRGDLISYQEDILERLPTRARKIIKTGDILIAKNISSLGNVMIVPKSFNGQLASTGFIVLRPKDKKERNLLWAVARSELMKKQMYYLSATAVQPEVSEKIFKEKIVFAIPKDDKINNKIEDDVEKTQDYIKGISKRTEDIDKELNNLFGI